MNNAPAITITAQDAERLESLLDSLSPDAFPQLEVLERELERAIIVEPDKIPPTVVTMNSVVRFKLRPSGAVHRLKLVYPRHSAAEGETVSILAPVGSALLGLAEGDEITWPNASGGTLQLVVDHIEYQPERSGNFEL
ncbi:GreA/GreB family elongation factor [Oleidesulfovibrio alaskensis G20]|uniref:GreA/GreB family elongation factor n=1 Tax=Oleidesulfovibrio alaskensis (strain ATCC BAA-1058 / DSM 17464 / G20) TaxID=207559 RepID=Q312U7_OLEA2|nr:nucleoside diphosphate kinase regulator [Oleidesulfovibrio alaskensis]ABB38049.1 GreA/GreB family elongation factor [Oleidesulfovibrio alaskensis G20]MBG0773970.1 nucleoside diphosphate kinase regulator [Oleidesulfovibrio alaskensis]